MRNGRHLKRITHLPEHRQIVRAKSPTIKGKRTPHWKQIMPLRLSLKVTLMIINTSMWSQAIKYRMLYIYL